MKRVLFSLITFATIFTMGMIDVSAASVLPAAKNGKIQLTENVTLVNVYTVDEDTTVTIDLNGFVLTGPSDNYAIDNNGTLSIIDSATKKGSITCSAIKASCVRNNGGTMDITGVTINSNFVSVKNEENSTLTINDSKLTSSYTVSSGFVTGVLLNAGTATVNNSIIDGGDGISAVYATSVDEKDSETNLNNCTLKGEYSLNSKRDASSSDTKQVININGGTINDNLSISSKGSIITLKGNVKSSAVAISQVMKYATAGANITLTEDYNDGIIVPEDVKLIIPEDVTVTLSGSDNLVIKGTLDLKGNIDAVAFLKEYNIYYGRLKSAVKATGAVNPGQLLTVELLKNDTTESDVAASKGKNLTIDLKGFSTNSNITNYSENTLTIKDTSENGTGVVSGTVTNAGTMALEGGKYTKAPVTSANATNATTTLKGGTYPADAIENAIIPENQEVKENDDGTFSVVYKDADYDKVNKAIQKARDIDKNKYTEESYKALENAINAVVMGKKADEQGAVDNMEKAINDAINNLELASEPNPKTGDGIMSSILLGGISLIGLLGVGICLNKKRFN